MRLQRRTVPLWALILMAIAFVFLAHAVNLIPDGLFDLFLRAWPGLLVFAGLVVLLRDRLPLGGLIALLLTIALIVGIGFFAFNARAGEQRSDNQQPILQTLPDNVSLLRVRVYMLDTEVELLRALGGDRAVSGEYVGSLDNQIQVGNEVLPDNSVTLTLQETRATGFPFLETVGRGALQLELPANVPIDVEFNSNQGDIILNLSGTSLERLNVDARRGDVIVTLPEYEPQFSQSDDLLGTIIAEQGNLTLRVPPSVAGRFELEVGSGGVPQFDDATYNYLIGDILEAKLIESADIVVRYALQARAGLLRVDVPGADESQSP